MGNVLRLYRIVKILLWKLYSPGMSALELTSSHWVHSPVCESSHYAILFFF